MEMWVTNLAILHKTSAIRYRMSLLSFTYPHTLVSTQITIYFVTKWNLLFCYFFEITNSDKQNLKWIATKLLVNLQKNLGPYFCVNNEIQRTFKKEGIFRFIMSSCNEMARFTSTVLIIKKGIVWLRLCIDVSGESTLHARVKPLLGLWAWISKAAYQRKQCTLIMNANNEQSCMINLKKLTYLVV